MNRITSRVLVGAIAATAVAACSETMSPNASDDLLANALTTLSPGVSELSTSFSTGATGAAWVPGPGGPGRNGLAGGGMLGAGLGDDFNGNRAFDDHGGPGRGARGGPFGNTPNCTGGTYSAATGVVTCPTETVNGLTITRTVAYKNAAGAAQAAYDSATTNSIVDTRSVTGTTTFTPDTGRGGHHGPGGPGFFGLGRGPDSSRITVTTATTTVANSSTRSVTGLAAGSTQRTVNSKASSKEATTGSSSAGAFTASRTMGDTTTGLVIPVATTTNTRPYPTAGTVIRAMSATVTFTGKAAQTTTRREVLTYDGSATAKLTITQDGTTKSCTIALPNGRPSCS